MCRTRPPAARRAPLAAQPPARVLEAAAWNPCRPAIDPQRTRPEKHAPEPLVSTFPYDPLDKQHASPPASRIRRPDIDCSRGRRGRAQNPSASTQAQRLARPRRVVWGTHPRPQGRPQVVSLPSFYRPNVPSSPGSQLTSRLRTGLDVPLERTKAASSCLTLGFGRVRTTVKVSL